MTDHRLTNRCLSTKTKIIIQTHYSRICLITNRMAEFGSRVCSLPGAPLRKGEGGSTLFRSHFSSFYRVSQEKLSTFKLE